MKEKDESADWENSIARAVFYVEKEVGPVILWDYPLMKFQSQLDNLKVHYDEEKKQYERSKRR